MQRTNMISMSTVQYSHHTASRASQDVVRDDRAVRVFNIHHRFGQVSHLVHAVSFLQHKESNTKQNIEHKTPVQQKRIKTQQYATQHSKVVSCLDGRMAIPT